MRIIFVIGTAQGKNGIVETNKKNKASLSVNVNLQLKVVQFHHFPFNIFKERSVNYNMLKRDELLKIEEEIKELEKKRKNILEEAKKVENEKKESRKKEVEDAYDNFVTLLEAYEKDFGGGYKVSLVGNFSL